MSEQAVVQVEFISILEAVTKNINRLRQPKWAFPFDHIRIDILSDGTMGPFVHLYGPTNQAFNGKDPVTSVAWMYDLTSKEWVIYSGPLPDSEEYKAKVAECNEYFSDM
ncbi:MAG: hypothetical protein JWP00_1495 [Chloroflexi bacterium]|nr:hypothetical protein [Chloroflexota bacterium]